MFRTRAVRWVLLFILTTSFFITLYSFHGTPMLQEVRLSLTASRKLSSTNDVNYISNVCVPEVISELYEHNLTCHQYFSDYLNSTDNIPQQRNNSASLMLYQPPCPLGNLSDFRYLINRDICEVEDVYMLILVGSHPKNRQIRHVLRKTIGKPGMSNLPVKMAFLFGHVDDGQQRQELEEESRNFSDIIQGSFADSYHNVTLRDLMGLRWAWQYCPQARFVVRMDDDVSVDVYKLVDALEGHHQQLKTTVGCFQMLVDTPVFRSGRYAVSAEEHPGGIYDPYCQGWLYVLMPRTAYHLDVASLRNKQYWMNDAYITGTLVKALGEKPVDFQVTFTLSTSELSNSKNKSPPLYVVGPTSNNVELMLTLHQNYQNNAQLYQLPKFKWTTKSNATKFPPRDNLNHTRT